MVEKKIDRNNSNNLKLVCNVVDSALPPSEASSENFTIIGEMVVKSVNSSCPTVSA